MKQKLRQWWKRHSLQVYDALSWLSVIVVVGSLLLFIILVAALGNDTAEGNNSMEGFLTFLKDTWVSILVSVISGSIIGAVSGGLTSKRAVKKTMEEFTEKVNLELEKLYQHLQNNLSSISIALNPDNRMLHEEHDKIQNGITSIEKRNTDADAKFAALDKSTQNIVQTIDGFQKLVLESASSEQEQRVKIMQLEEQCEKLERENQKLKQENQELKRQVPPSVPKNAWGLDEDGPELEL